MLVEKTTLMDTWKVSQRGTFKDSMMWKGNQQAYCTARGFCECWDNAPDVTVIYGELGCGKYHLMKSMFKELLSTNQVSIICTMDGYSIREDLSCEDLNSADVLFLHNFCRAWESKELHNAAISLLKYFLENGKKIVLSGTYPHETWCELKNYIPEILSNTAFLEIKNPDKEECKKLIRFWIHKENYEKYGLDEEMIEFIAEKGTTNVRILEGTLTKVIAMARLERQETVTMEFLKQIFEP